MPALRPLRPRPSTEPYPTAAEDRSLSPDPAVKQETGTEDDFEPDASRSPSSEPTPKLKGKGKPRGKKATVKAEPGETSSSGEVKGGYDRALLVSLVAKSSKADYAALAYAVNKSAAQCRDTWRKTVYPALMEGRDWSSGGPGWDHAMKLHLAREVLGTAKPEWAVVAQSFPGHTSAQVHDIWRKVVLPRLMSGKTLH